MIRFVKFAAVMSAAVSLSVVAFADDDMFSGVYAKPMIGLVKPVGKIIPNFGGQTTSPTAASLAKKLSNSSVVGLAVGTEVTPGLRMELEVSHRGNFTNNIAKQAGLFTPTQLATITGGVLWSATPTVTVGQPVISSSAIGAAQTANIDFSLSSKIKANSLMFNGYYDIELGTNAFTPFFGFGLGMSKLKAIGTPTVTSGTSSVYTAVATTANAAPIFYTAIDLSRTINKSKVSYSFAVGASVKMTERVSAELKIQYIDLGKLSATVGTNTSSIHVKATEALLGLRIGL